MSMKYDIVKEGLIMIAYTELSPINIKQHKGNDES